MYDDCDGEGLDGETFREYIHEYYNTLMHNRLPKDLHDILNELRYVDFEHKLGYVIWDLNKKKNE
jgi:hypothetical protein